MMDELQDALQDAQYMGVIVSETPRPTSPFLFPTDEELAASGLNSPKSMHQVVTSPLGFFMLQQMACSSRSMDNRMFRCQLEFLEQINWWRNASVGKAKTHQATLLCRAFLRVSPENPESCFSKSEIPVETPDLLMALRKSPDPNRGLPFVQRLIPEMDLELYSSWLEGDTDSTEKKKSSSNQQHSMLRVKSSKCREIANSILEPSLATTVFDEIEMFVMQDIEQRFGDVFRKSSYWTQLIQYWYVQTRDVNMEDFRSLRLLGRGGFGVVLACAKKDTGMLYAMKMMNKKLIKKKKAEKLCLMERELLALIQTSPFIVCLKYSFQTPDDVVLILDLRTGGDLSFHLMQQVRFSQEQVTLWGAQILLGLQHLHENNIVYRDLKPENILLDDFGNCSISDLGLAVRITPTLSGRCGTRGYWAPEMLVRNTDGSRLCYNHAIDWWSYGVLLYELLYGKCPFRSQAAKALHEDKQMAYDIATLELELEYDEEIFSPEAIELISGLLCRDPKSRLGFNGADEIKALKFFENVDWIAIEGKTIVSPYVPSKDINAASQADIGLFDLSEAKDQIWSADDTRMYQKWNFKSKIAFEEEVVHFLSHEEKRGLIPVVKDTESCCSVS